MICVTKKKDDGTKNLLWPTELIGAFEETVVADGLNQRQKSVLLIASFLAYLRASDGERATVRALAAAGHASGIPWKKIIADARAANSRAVVRIVDSVEQSPEDQGGDCPGTGKSRQRSLPAKPKSP